MATLQPGDSINHRYQIVRSLGAGAMGTVYLVEDLVKYHRRVALKVLKAENLDDSEVWSKGEYEALTRLRHPNLARVFDFGRILDSDDFYIVSEFIRGQNLLSATRDASHEEFLDLVAQVCRALEYIHTQGYVHFDIKPDNILVTRDRVIGSEESSKVQWTPDPDAPSDKGNGPMKVKLIDFGLAEKITGTFKFAIKGTMNYVAPEIIRGQTPDKKADLFSFGVTLYQIVAGKFPFVDSEGQPISRTNGNWHEQLKQELSKEPTYMVNILLRLLEDDPQARFNSAREIIQALNAGAGRHYQVETAETQVSYLYCSRLIGRRTELNRLKEEAEMIFCDPFEGKDAKPRGDTSVVTRLLRDDQRKRTPLFLISGEIGVGKSRLFEEFSHFLKMREIPMHAGNSYETSHDPYQPFREIIGQKAISIGLDSEVFRKHAAAVRRLCPRLRSLIGGEEEESGFRPDKERLYFIDSLANFLIESAVLRPSVITLNNLHWVDDSSTELLAHLIDEIVQAEAKLPYGLPLMLVATMRVDESLPEALRSLFTRLREDERIREISLRRFNRTQIAELIHHMLQIDRIPAPLLDRLEERTSGNPLFIVETLKSLQEQGLITRGGDSWKIREGGDLSRVEMPHGIGAILLHRVRMLDPQKQQLLEALAVYDKPMSSKLLDRLPDLGSIDVVGELRELENRGMVLKSFDAGRLLFSVSQPKLREIIYENLTEARCRVLHGSLADVLSAEYSGDEDEIVEDLAYHYQRSDRSGKALELTVKAGDIMRRIFAHDRAIEHYRHVLRRTESIPEHRRIWFETHEKIGDIGTISGDYELAQGSYQILLDNDPRDALSVGDRARVLRKKGKLDEIQGDYDRALRCYKEAHDLLEREDPSGALRAELVRTYNALGWVYVCMGLYDKAMAISADALRSVEGLKEKNEHAIIYSTIGSANFYKGNIEQAIEFHARSLAIHENLENIPEVIIALNNLGEAYHSSGEYMDALKHYRQAHSVAEEIGDAFGRAMALHRLAETHLDLGDAEQAEGFLADSLELSSEYHMRFLTTINYHLRGRLRKQRGDLDKAEGDIFRALGVFAKQGSRLGLATSLREIAEIQHLRGNHEEALKLIKESIGNTLVLNVAALEARARLVKMRILRAAGKASENQLMDELRVVSRVLEGSKNVELLGELELEHGELSIERKDLQAARESFRRAENYFREVADRLPPELRESYLALHQVRCSVAPGKRQFREVTASAGKQAPASSRAAPIPQAPPAAALSRTQEEMLRVASLLQEVGETGPSRLFAQKVLNCLIQAVRADEGFLLSRRGNDVKILCGLDNRGEMVRNPSGRLSLEILEDAWDMGKPILAPRVIDDPMVQGHEGLYRNNIGSLAVIPLKIDGALRGAIYLNNPCPDELKQPSGGPLLVAYQNLLTLIVPKPVPT
ncbi:MAG: serine/threonine-protein kinase PknK [Planctomycetota bacterium]